MNKSRKRLLISLILLTVLILLPILYRYCFFLFRIGSVALKKPLIVMHLKEINQFSLTLKGYVLWEFGKSFFISSSREMDLKSNPRELFLFIGKNPEGKTITLEINSSDLVECNWGHSDLYNYALNHKIPFRDNFFNQNGRYEFLLEVKDSNLLNASLWFSYTVVAGTYSPCNIDVGANLLKIPEKQLELKEHRTPNGKDK